MESANVNFDEFVEASLEHGRVRFKQGFDVREVAREYRLLRQTIFDNLETPLLRLSPTEQYRAVRLIDAVLDEAIAPEKSSHPTQSKSVVFASCPTVADRLAPCVASTELSSFR